MDPFYPCSRTMMTLWLNPRKNAKNACWTRAFPVQTWHCLWPVALGDVFSMWHIFVGAREESLPRHWFSLAGEEVPTDWSIPAFGSCGRGLLQFSPKTPTRTESSRCFLSMLTRDNCNQWWSGFLRLVMGLTWLLESVLETLEGNIPLTVKVLQMDS